MNKNITDKELTEDERKELCKIFLNIARQDLEASKILYDQNYYAFATYHLSQSVEKAIKFFFIKWMVDKEHTIKLGHDHLDFKLLSTFVKISTYINCSSSYNVRLLRNRLSYFDKAYEELKTSNSMPNNSIPIRELVMDKVNEYEKAKA